MEKAIEIFVAINLFVIGASHLFQPQAWVDFFKLLRSYGKAGAMFNGFLSLSFGSIIVSFHWVWEGVIPIIITCLGLAQIVKSLVAFVVPDVSLRTMYTPMAESPLNYRIGGAISVGFAVTLMYQILIR